MEHASRPDVLSEFWAAPGAALFSQKVIAVVRSCSEGLLERDRWAGGGIPYLKIGRHVRYRKSDVVTWLDAQQRCHSTAEYCANAGMGLFKPQN